MARKMQINRLDKDELEYLLTIRGIALGNCDEMRKRLSSAMRMESEGSSVKHPPYPFDFAFDHDAVKSKLESVEKLIQDFDAGRLSSEAQKIRTKIAFVMERLDNMDPEDDVGLMKQKSELLGEAFTLADAFHVKIENFESRPGVSVPVTLSLLQGQVEAQSFQAGIHMAPVSSPIGQSAPTAGPSASKSIPPHKWDMKKFLGDPRAVSVHSFFEKVEELRTARNVSKDVLLDSGIDLFGDRAYQFYKDCRKRVNSWDELVTEFKREYLPSNHSDLLLEELRRRTQHPSETIGVYLAVMSSYFERLGFPVTEETRLGIVMKNLHPFYQDRLRDPLPTSLSELREVCRRMEARRDLINSYAEPSATRRTTVMERDLAFVSAGDGVDRLAAVAPPSGGSPKDIVCFRCNKTGHYARGCTSRSKKYCFQCRKDGYTVKTCPDCTKASGNAKQHR